MDPVFDDATRFALAQRGRVRVELLDYPAAIQYFQRAVDAEDYRSNPYANYYLRFELGLAKVSAGEVDMGRAVLLEVANDIGETLDEPGAIWGNIGSSNIKSEECVRFYSRLVAGDPSLTRQEIYKTIAYWESEFPDKVPDFLFWGGEALGLAYERVGDVPKAIKIYEETAMARNFDNETVGMAGPEQRLVELYSKEDLLRRGSNFFEKLLQHRESFLPEHHPGRAYAMELLAKMLLQS